MRAKYAKNRNFLLTFYLSKTLHYVSVEMKKKMYKVLLRLEFQFWQSK